MFRVKRNEHIPVLTDEVIKGLGIRKGELYIDATVGDGGHAEEIIKKGGRLLAIDRDPEAVKRAKKRLEDVFPTQSFTCVVANFNILKDIASRYGFEEISGILFDLGVSSTQLKDPKKGLSFTHDAPLDMRLDPKLKRTARDLVNQLSKAELYEIFTRNAQEELARPIAEVLISARSLKPIETTRELAEIISNAVGRQRKAKIHSATKVFLALRIEVNQEIENLKQGLTQAIELLKKEGRLVVVSFHETEDRIVKRKLRKASQEGRLINLTKKPITPTQQEILKNPRSRSAKLRIAKHI